MLLVLPTKLLQKMMQEISNRAASHISSQSMLFTAVSSDVVLANKPSKVMKAFRFSASCLRLMFLRIQVVVVAARRSQGLEKHHKTARGRVKNWDNKDATKMSQC